jgi:hypothetical protein
VDFLASYFFSWNNCGTITIGVIFCGGRKNDDDKSFMMKMFLTADGASPATWGVKIIF